MLDNFVHHAPADVVLVHGAGGNNLLWKRTMQELIGESRAVAVNLPGHPSGGITCRTIEQYSESLHDFVLQTDAPKPVICGHSMGGAIALRYAIDHPDRIGGLVLVSTGAKLGVDPAIVSGLGGGTLKAIEQIITPRSFYEVDLGLGREARAALSVSNLPVFLNDYLACRSFDVRKDIRGITARTLVLCGDKDQMTPPKWSHYLASNILDSKLWFVKDSGHMMPLEKPQSLGRLLQSFLSELTR